MVILHPLVPVGPVLQCAMSTISRLMSHTHQAQTPGAPVQCLDATQPYDPRPAYFMRETVDVILTRQTLADSRDPDCTWPNGLRPAACVGNGGRGPGVLAGHNRMINGRQRFMWETADVIVTCQSLTDSRNLVWSRPNGLRPAALRGKRRTGPWCSVLTGHNHMIHGRPISCGKRRT